MSDCNCELGIKDKSQKKILIVLLLINAGMFVLEFGLGWYAQSTGLIADSIDMFADATVYGIGLYAIGRSISHKARAALISGWFQQSLGLLIFVDVIRRVIVGSEPVSVLIIGVGAAALVANVFCLRLIERHRHGDIHMRASWIFSRNDVIANIGVISGGLLVWTFDSRWPDLVVGALIAMVILKGGRQIVRDAREEMAASLALSSTESVKRQN